MAEPQTNAAKKEQQIKKHDFTSDALYIVGAGLVCAGLAIDGRGVSPSLIAAGCFCLLFPILELTLAFVRGLRR
jgi:hypothetical protein